MILKKIKLLLVFVIGILNCHAQNLVPNHSFEQCTRCPETDGDSKVVKFWYEPTLGSTDYFNACASKLLRPPVGKNSKLLLPVNVPHNFRDIRYAQDGNAYVGMIFYSAIGHSEYREYFSTKLLSELVKGKQYNVSYYVCYSSSSGIAISNMEALFSHDSIRQANESRIDKVPQLTYKGGILKDTVWTKISWVYTAKGDEQFLTIGNFTKSIECNKEMPDPRRKDYKVAYYFVDNVCVALMNADSSCNCEEPGIAGKHLSIEKNKNITLNNVFFESDKSELLPASFAELDELTAYLKKNSSNIEITGYTDNTGTQEKNLSLSEARAKAVADYLVSKGIKENRVKYKGFGSANPVTTNDTESGKAKNRRVEFKIASK